MRRALAAARVAAAVIGWGVAIAVVLAFGGEAGLDWLMELMDRGGGSRGR